MTMNNGSARGNDGLFSSEQGETRPPKASLARTLATALNYDFERAVADLIDNSIAANAKNVWVFIDTVDGDYGSSRAFVAVCDDGEGMSASTLSDALEYGHQSDDNARNLGRFGLGMKTASTSQSFVLAVATRESSESDYVARAWDIPWIEARGEWRLRIPKLEIFPGPVMDRIEGSSGTVVLLPDLSRMKSNINTLKKFNQSQVLAPKIKKCEDYLRAVFHRFMTGRTLSEEYAGQTVNIHLNNRKLIAWDPYMEDDERHVAWSLPDDDLRRLTFLNQGSKAGGAEGPLRLTLNGKVMDLRFHILPKMSKSDPAFEEAGGIKSWNSQQGVYFYRLDRLIQSGGWCGLLANDEHTKLARLSIDVGRNWDSLLELTATKDRIIIPDSPAEYRKDFKAVFGRLRGAAKRIYDGNAGTTGGEANGGGEDVGGGAGGADDETGGGGDRGGGTGGEGVGGGGTGGGGTGGGGTGGNGAAGGGSGRRSGGGGTRPRPHKLDQKTFDRMVEVCETDEEISTLDKIWRRARAIRTSR